MVEGLGFRCLGVWGFMQADYGQSMGFRGLGLRGLGFRG